MHIDPCNSAANRSSVPHWTSTPRFEIDALVVAQRPIIGHEFEIVLHAPEIARSAGPGQFVEILFGENYSPLVRRPFSIFRVDRDAGTFSVLYLARGAFTSGLAMKMEGDRVSVLGPLGRPFHWPKDPSVQHILVAGGLGAPPLYFLASELTKINGSHIVVLNAARTESLLVGLSEFGELEIILHVMTDDGSQGTQGMATDLLEAILEARCDTDQRCSIYACGPMPMLRSVGEIAMARELPCQVSIETTMPCGIGLCQGCATAVRDVTSPSGFRYALACVEGAVFEARDLVW